MNNKKDNETIINNDIKEETAGGDSVRDNGEINEENSGNIDKAASLAENEEELCDNCNGADKEMDKSEKDSSEKDAKEAKTSKESDEYDKKLAEQAAKLAEYEKKLAENDDLNDRYLRMMAEYDNYRKRAAKEKEGIYSDAYCDALKELLGVLDNLERAALFGEGENSSSCPESSNKVLEGLKITLNAFYDTLKRMGVEEIEAQGKPFDPDIHNAVMHTEDDSVGENTVTEVLQKGYRKGDKIIRYAVVAVAN